MRVCHISRPKLGHPTQNSFCSLLFWQEMHLLRRGTTVSLYDHIKWDTFQTRTSTRFSWINSLPCHSDSVCTSLGLLLVYPDYLSALPCWILFADRRPTLTLWLLFVLSVNNAPKKLWAYNVVLSSVKSLKWPKQWLVHSYTYSITLKDISQMQ